ncbi:MAG TPA: patatin-like phospholipase family protein [Candidatus Angelobacter sp.]
MNAQSDTAKNVRKEAFPDDARDGKDAVCFTPGFPGATFGAGVIHAYLAADRDPPKVAAGISLGTVSAAVMQRCYRDLRNARKDEAGAKKRGDSRPERIESARWQFFNKYLSFLGDEPFSVLWNGIPDPPDFSADLPPIKDPVPDSIQDGAARAAWKEQERAARRELYLFVKLGHWFSRLPVKTSALATTLVTWVRAQENYPSPKILRFLWFAGWLLYVAVSLVLQVVRFPTWFPEDRFAKWRDNPGPKNLGFYLRTVRGWFSIRPLFGKGVFFVCAAALLLLALVLGMLSSILLGRMLQDGWFLSTLAVLAGALFMFLTASLATLWVPMKGSFPFRSAPMWGTLIAVFLLEFVFRTQWFWDTEPGKTLLARADTKSPNYQVVLLVACLLYLLVLVLLAAGILRTPDRRDGLIKHVLSKVAMEKHIVHDYHLKHALVTLFGENHVSPPLTKDPFPIVLVASPLQTFSKKARQNNQLWASSQQDAATTRRDPMLVDVLRAAMAIPAVFDPATVKKGDSLEFWYKSDGPAAITGQAPEQLDLVDGSVIRHNPLPAFFLFIKQSPELARSLESRGPEEAAVHVVYNVPAQTQAANSEAARKMQDIVDVAFLSVRLAQRRDINLEITQTNFLGNLASATNTLTEKLRKSAPGTLERIQGEFSGMEENYAIFADNIAPNTDLSFKNPIAPEREEVVKHVVAGCKATLERLYAGRIQAEGTPEKEGVTIQCPALLAALRRSKGGECGALPGSPEVCGKCDKKLTVSNETSSTSMFADREKREWAEREDLLPSLPQLTSEEPRVVFVASGGVFRGPFHAGMINALLALKVRPDLIVGASVGTLVGSAMAATLAAEELGPDEAPKLLGELVSVFQNVDEQIAFTKVLKNAARELGLRGRRIDLSLAELRLKILEGSRSDVGFAVTGTPPALIDAISELLLIPHQETAKIAAEFVAGHFTDALRRLVRGLKQETLRRLGIVHAVMGTSLLEPAARRLMGASLTGPDGNPWYDMTSTQPFQAREPIAVFGTTTDLLQQRPVLLGRYKFNTPSYDYVNACLASSAFPAVFAPRADEQIFPGCGVPGTIYSDGGMFDNLPIAPALELLEASQRSWINRKGLDAIDQLGARAGRADLFITGSLDVSPSPKETDFDNLVAIYKRAGTMQNNLKIQAFEELSNYVNRRLKLLHKLLVASGARTDTLEVLSGKPADYYNKLVNVTFLPVYPTDKEHLNGTFQFCNSLGRKPETINRSMADGCFQTMRELAKSFDYAKASAETKSTDDAKAARATAVQALADKQRIPRLAVRQPDLEKVRYPKSGANGLSRWARWRINRTLKSLMSAWKPAVNHSTKAGHACVFFALNEKGRDDFVCPFSRTSSGHAVFATCIADASHQKWHLRYLRKVVERFGRPEAKKDAARTAGAPH